MGFSLVEVITNGFCDCIFHRVVVINRRCGIFNSPSVVVNPVQINRPDLYIDRRTFHHRGGRVVFYIFVFIYFISCLGYRPLKFIQISFNNQRIPFLGRLELTVIETTVIGVCHVVPIIFNSVIDGIIFREVDVM